MPGGKPTQILGILSRDIAQTRDPALQVALRKVLSNLLLRPNLRAIRNEKYQNMLKQILIRRQEDSITRMTKEMP